MLNLTNSVWLLIVQIPLSKLCRQRIFFPPKYRNPSPTATMSAIVFPYADPRMPRTLQLVCPLAGPPFAVPCRTWTEAFNIHSFTLASRQNKKSIKSLNSCPPMPSERYL